MRTLLVATAARSPAAQGGRPLGQRPTRAKPCVPVAAAHSRVCTQAAVSASAASAAELAATQQLLDAFWVAQGVAEEGHRWRLVAAALAGLPSSALLSAEALSLREGELAALPGVSSTWFLDSLDRSSGSGVARKPELATGAAAAAAAPPEVLEVSRRLVALRALLGGRLDIDIGSCHRGIRPALQHTFARPPLCLISVLRPSMLPTPSHSRTHSHPRTQCSWSPGSLGYWQQTSVACCGGCWR